MKGQEGPVGGGDRSRREASDAGGSADTAASKLYPCSYTQKRIWYSQQIDPDSSHWNVGMRWQLRGALRDTTVERAWQILADRHESLRTGIEEFDGMPYQRVWDQFQPKVGIIDISRLPPDQRASAADEIASNDAKKPIALTASPPFRIQLIRIDVDTSILLTNFHNVIVDGWSVGVLIREFGHIAAQLQAGQTLELPEVLMQHVDYTLWQEDMLESGSFDADKVYWKKLLANWKRFEIEPDRPRPAVLTHEGEIRTVLLPRQLSDALTGFARMNGASMFHVGISALSAALSNASGNPDVFIGTQTACRDEPELAGLVGPLINTAALRFDAAEDPTLIELLKRCRQRCTEAMTHQHLPFNFVVEAQNPSRDPSRNLMYSILFTAQTAHIDTGQMGDLTFDGLTIAAMPSFSAGAQTDLGFFMVGREEGWRLSCAGNTDLFEIATIDRLLESWAQAVEALVAHGGTMRLSELAAQKVHRYPAVGLSGAHRSQPVALSPVDGQNEIEARIAEVWKEVLDIDGIGGDTDYFDAGGTSLSAMRMLSRVSKAFGKSFALTTLLRNPMLREFATSIAKIVTPTVVAREGIADKVVGPASRAGARQNIIALNNGLAYRFIQRHLSHQYSVVDVPIGTEEDIEFAATHDFVELSERVVERIIEAQPEGPLVIMSYCAMGIVAYEAARQLAARGRTVKQLIVLNATAPYYNEKLGLKARWLRRMAQVREAAHYFRVLLAMRKRGEITTEMFLRHYTTLRKLGIPKLLLKLKLIDPAPIPSDFESLLEFPIIVKGLFASAPRQTKKIDCDVAVFTSRDMLKGPAFPPALGWQDCVTGNARVFNVNGLHSEMLTEVVAIEIAHELVKVLDGGQF